MTKKELQKWLKDHPAISARQIAIEAGYKDGGRFQRWIKMPNEKGEQVPAKMLRRMSPVLEKYGMKTTK